MESGIQCQIKSPAQFFEAINVKYIISVKPVLFHSGLIIRDDPRSGNLHKAIS